MKALSTATDPDAASLPFDARRGGFAQAGLVLGGGQLFRVAGEPELSLIHILNQTEYTHPCMVAFACGVTAVLAEHGVQPDVVAGLSLGEY